MPFYILSGIKSVFFFLLLPKRIKLVCQIAERHTDGGDDDVGNGGPPLEHFNEEFQAEVIDKDVS